jgi:glycosyltransferase involved in cell wall biosynthesis
MVPFDATVKRGGKRTEPPIRLALVIYALEVGGSEMLALRIAGALNAGRRHVCSIYGTQGSGGLLNMLAAENIPAKAFYKNGRFDLRLIMRLAKQFRADGIQLVHTHHLGQLLYGGIAGRLSGARVIHTEHEYYTLSPLRLRRLLRILSILADAVTAVAEPVTEFLHSKVGIPLQKLRTIPNGVDVGRFSTARPIDRASLGWEDGDVVVGCIARLEPEKGHVILLEAFRQVHGRHPKAKLLLIGDGTERRYLEQMSSQFGLKDSVLFSGIRRDIPELLATCDMTVLASSHEGLPIAVLEAMAAGKPLVATRVGSVPKVVINGETGLLVRAGDANALAEALETLIKDQSERQRLGKNGFDLVRAHHSFDQTIAQYTTLYDSFLNDHAHWWRRRRQSL